MSGELPGDVVIRADERSAPFFAAAARDVLLIRRCPDCGHWAAPEAAGCPGCGGGTLDWAPASGHGTLVSWTGPAHSNSTSDGDGREAADADPVSGVPALVELAEGPWLHTWLVTAHPSGPDGADKPGRLRAGLPVAVSFAHPAVGESYPVFRPAAAGAGRPVPR